jgi:hypothetical protein
MVEGLEPGLLCSYSLSFSVCVWYWGLNPESVSTLSLELCPQSFRILFLTQGLANFAWVDLKLTFLLLCPLSRWGYVPPPMIGCNRSGFPFFMLAGLLPCAVHHASEAFLIFWGPAHLRGESSWSE